MGLSVGIRALTRKEKVELFSEIFLAFPWFFATNSCLEASGYRTAKLQSAPNSPYTTYGPSSSNDWKN